MTTIDRAKKPIAFGKLEIGDKFTAKQYNPNVANGFVQAQFEKVNDNQARDLKNGAVRDFADWRVCYVEKESK